MANYVAFCLDSFLGIRDNLYVVIGKNHPLNSGLT